MTELDKRDNGEAAARGCSLSPCDTDTYIRNIIFSNISEILFMCIIDYFKMFSHSCAKTELKTPSRK